MIVGPCLNRSNPSNNRPGLENSPGSAVLKKQTLRLSAFRDRLFDKSHSVRRQLKHLNRSNPAVFRMPIQLTNPQLSQQPILRNHSRVPLQASRRLQHNSKQQLLHPDRPTVPEISHGTEAPRARKLPAGLPIAKIRGRMLLVLRQAKELPTSQHV